MPLEQHLEQTQKLVLTQTMQQSLQCLQMSALDLCSYLQDAALSNPFLDVEEAPLGDLLPEAAEKELHPAENLPIELREQISWDSTKNSSLESGDFTACFSHPQSFSDELNDQLGQLASLDASMLAVCQYLVGCLNSAGYLDCPLDELARELNLPLFDLEQALYVIQALDPPGVGARSLSECLLLQLSQGDEFSEVNIHLIQAGLPLLAENDYAGLSKLLGVRQAEVQRAVAVIRALNPIPSRGFYTESNIDYIFPEASIYCDRDQVVIEMNNRAFPRATLNRDYCALIGNQDCPDAQGYLKKQMTAAKGLLVNVQDRYNTLYRLLSVLVQNQKEYFLHGGSLSPMTMKQVADQLELNVSTVSRAVKDKYVQFNGHPLLLRKLFTAALSSSDGQMVSAEAARQQLRRFVAAENSRKPLSDEALSEALAGCGILLSRRTVAKYRSELGIAAASARKHAAP